MSEAELLEKQRAGDENGEPRLSYPEIDNRLRLLMGDPRYHLPHEDVEPIDDALWMLRTQMREIERLNADNARKAEWIERNGGGKRPEDGGW